MKKIFLLLTVFSMVFTSCDPLEDIHDEIDAIETVISGEAAYTLTDDDYTGDIEDGGFGFSFTNFDSEDDAKEAIPAFLTSKYPVWGDESLVTVTFNLYNKKNDEKDLTIYEVTSADYTAAGHSYDNFSSFSDITDFLDAKYPDAVDRLLVSLSYLYYSGGTTYELENGFINNDGTWEMSTGISDAEYAAMGEGRPQFSSEDEAFQKIPVYLVDKFKFDGKVAGDIEGIMYKLYVEDSFDIDNDEDIEEDMVYSFVAFFIFDGSAWSAYNNQIQQSIKFGHDGTSWVPDNTIKYTLTAADYDSLGTEYGEPGFFDNFDVRAGKPDEKEGVRLIKINTILKNNFPSDEDDQKYIVSYNVYTGADAVYSLSVIKDGADYRLQTADD